MFLLVEVCFGLFHHRQLDRRTLGCSVEPQLVRFRCPRCLQLGALATAPAPPQWRCNACRGRGDPEGCRVARRAVAAYRSGSVRGEATLKSMLQSAIKRGTWRCGRNFCLKWWGLFCRDLEDSRSTKITKAMIELGNSAITRG